MSVLVNKKGEVLAGLVPSNEIKFLTVTLTDTIPANQQTAPGVNISTLTDGLLNDSSRIKGISMFNGYATFLGIVWYQGKIILGDPSNNTVAQDRTFNIPLVIMYV